MRSDAHLDYNQSDHCRTVFPLIRVPTPGDTIHVSLEQFAVDDSILEETDIEWAMKRLHTNRSRVSLQAQA